MAIFWNDGTSLYHFGIPGMKWGQRRWQNEDGSFNEEGKIRYGRVSERKTRREEKRKARQEYRKQFISTMNSRPKSTAKERIEKGKKLDEEANKLFKKYPKLRNDFGGWEYVDDPDYLAVVLDEYGIEATAYKKALDEFNKN